MLATFASAASAGDLDTVKALYSDAFTATASTEKRAVALQGLADNWQSIGDYSGKSKSRDELARQLTGFFQLIPDLTWEIEQIVQSGDIYVVRGRATGTPKGPLFGVDGKGKSFTIMSIDIHKIENGKIATSHHVEDWAGALRQLSAK
ncbi:MAG TPA: ester cyclase [Rhabdaerophilum sp.]|nr:ester cyclase [Rhabdaerophilum sp.]